MKPFVALLIAVSLPACAHSVIIVRQEGVLIRGDLTVRGQIINTQFWGHVSDLKTSWGARNSYCGSNGTYNGDKCTCDFGFCGTNCSTTDSNPVQFVSQTRSSSTSLSMVFRGNVCQNLTTADQLRLVRGSCDTPTTILLEVASPTIAANGQATFSWNPTGIPALYIVCYKANVSNSYHTITAQAASTPPCPTAAHYVCPTDGSCAADCTACTGYTLFNNANPSRTCSKLVSPSGQPFCTAVMACGACGAYSGPVANFFNGNTGDYGHSALVGECATWVRLDQDYYIHRLQYYARSGQTIRAQKYFLLLFTSSSPPGTTDNPATLRSKAFYTIVDWNNIPSTTPISQTFSPVVARYVMVYRNSSSQQEMNFAELDIWGTPA